MEYAKYLLPANFYEYFYSKVTEEDKYTYLISWFKTIAHKSLASTSNEVRDLNDLDCMEYIKNNREDILDNSKELTKSQVKALVKALAENNVEEIKLLLPKE